MRYAALVLGLAMASGCAASSHPTQAAKLGSARSSADLVAVLDTPGPLSVESVVCADWRADRRGLLNLDNPQARAAGLTGGDEPIQIYFHALRHPSYGLYLIDSGLERALRDAPDKSALNPLLLKLLERSPVKFRAPLGDWLAAQKEPLRGVFFTHLHLDHVLGVPDLPASTPLYTGPDEAGGRALMNVISRDTIDRALAGKPPLEEWTFKPDPLSRFDGVVDVFGDGSLWAIWVPGHTPGSTAYIARTAEGPVLLTGDSSHTRWGWDHGVEPGWFSVDELKNAQSLSRLRRLAAEHPSMKVVVGHQP